MSEFDSPDLQPELREIVEQLRVNRYEASPVELDRIKTRNLKRESGHRVARGRGMRKRTLVTAVIMFAAIGTGSAGAIGFGGGFFSLGSLFSGRTVSAPAAKTPAITSSIITPSITPAAYCVQYGCATTTSVSCSELIVVLGFTLFPADCTVTVTNTTNSATPDGSVVVSAPGAPPQTCTLSGSGATASCMVTFASYDPTELVVGPVSVGLFIPVTATYEGDSMTGLQPSSGTGEFLVAINVRL
jgi:hypothetical protein